MHIDTHSVTAEELLRMPEKPGYSFELDQGRLIQMPKSGALHGIVGMRLVTALLPFVDEHRLGVLFPQDTGFKLASRPDTVRGPDLSFVTRERIAAIGFPDGLWPGAPDLAVEVKSPSDTRPKLASKAREYLSYGTRLVWVIDPKRREVIVFRPNAIPLTLTSGDELDGGDVVPGFRFQVSRLFEA